MSGILAIAASLACQLAEPASVDVDGMLDDWDGVKPARANGKDKDQSFDVRCLFDGDRLAISIDVRDDLLSRRRKAHKELLGEDRVVVELSAGAEPMVFVFFPGTEKVAPKRTLGGKKLPKWITVEDTQQPKGWSVEIELPLAKVGGWSASAPSVDAKIVLRDSDELQEPADELAHPLTLTLGDKPKVFDRFLRETRLKKKDLVLDQIADVDPSRKGTERIVAGGTILGLIGEQYGYVELPVASAADVLEVELVDLRGNGGRVVLTHLRQMGGGGSRDLVAFWGASGGQLEQLFAVEVRKEADGNRLESTWKLAKKKKGKGMELRVEAQPAVGWDEDTFEEDSADDAEPIHLPWDDARTGGIYWLDGDTLRSKALAPGKKSRK
jgi:hypothetical protein